MYGANLKYLHTHTSVDDGENEKKKKQGELHHRWVNIISEKMFRVCTPEKQQKAESDCKKANMMFQGPIHISPPHVDRLLLLLSGEENIFPWKKFHEARK